MVTLMGAVSDTEWTVAAAEVGLGTLGSWTVQAIALCAYVSS
jgi:hypothetical protein